ncbi:hypothetical protein Moror_8075 [Moniliophthora roreri MCA 2997]|uniref:Uncharacterized protein n=1 Tax=Moniliophthora roreri (strain MCA 2997) TaxID=1381753 RepID=V2XKZ5_MONRO|nr:hypothetical protein Moror_8075 [Moniliophthora roreri MCA 2997]
MSSSASTSSTAKPAPSTPQVAPPEKSRIPVTPALLRSIFASSRTPLEERSISRAAFFRFAGFIFSCLAISLAATRNRGIRSSAALLNVV